MNRWLSFLDKSRNKQTLVTVLIIGIVLMLAAGSFSDTGDSVDTGSYIDSDEYCQCLETKLKNILSEMKGIGNVSVMITLENRNTIKNQPGEAVLKRTESTKVPMVTGELYPEIKGVVIAAQGASDPDVSEKIYYAAKAALDIGGSKIAVIEAK